MQIYQDFQEPQKAKILVEANGGFVSLLWFIWLYWKLAASCWLEKKAVPDPNK